MNLSFAWNSFEFWIIGGLLLFNLIARGTTVYVNTAGIEARLDRIEEELGIVESEDDDA